MSDRSRVGDITLALTALTALLAVASIAYGLWDESFFNKRRVHAEYQERSEQYQREASQDIAEACVGVADRPALFRACVQEQVHAYEANKPADEDLRAQQDMALWAYWMVAVSSGTAIVTAVGIYFVRETLIANSLAVDQARRSNEIAERNSHVELRAWIGFVAWTFEIGRDQNGFIVYVFRFEYQNLGSTPSKNVQLIGDVVESECFANNTVKFEDHSHRVVLPPGTRTSINIPKIFQPEDIMNSNRTPILVRIVLDYETVFEEHGMCRTDNTFEIRYVGAGDIGRVVNGKVDVKNFEVRTFGGSDVMT